MMNIINLTPHRVNICDENGKKIDTYKVSGKVARVAHGWETIDYVNGVPIVIRQDERIVDLPEPQEGTLYIVSNIILDHAKDRMDLIAPVKQVKVNGHVVGCRAFVSNRRKG